MEHREIKTPEQIAELKQRSPGGYRNLRESVINDLMPTPKALDGEKGNLKSSQERLDAGRQVDLPNIAVDLVQPIELFGTVTTATSGRSSEFRGNGTNVVEFAEEVAEKLNNLLPTPQVDDSKNTGHNQDRRLTLASEVWETERTTSWGKFEPAIRRWEQVLGRPAPAPTKPDGKDGAHRLSSKFTEWMMGLPDGWITDCGLSRNEELKACGNGVVPQQAELALRMLLDGIDLRVGGGQAMFPTPTVSDTYTDNLASTQQKPGSMHSVTLAQAAKWVGDV
jgi:DNA (cytosine-5)-methyltransferase 1